MTSGHKAITGDVNVPGDAPGRETARKSIPVPVFAGSESPHFPMLCRSTENGVIL